MPAAVLGYVLAVLPLLEAWNDLGHMTVAAIAYPQLTPAVRGRANSLLKLNPYYKGWLAMIPQGVPAADRQRMIFMIAATWPDQIKRDRAYRDDGVPGSHGERPEGPTSSQNLGYGDMLRHRYWHFVDNPFTQDGAKLAEIPSPNIRTQIPVFLQVLSAKSADPLKSYDLTWLLHLVGDIHQPLHCISRYCKAQPNGDEGGNKVMCTNCRSELHACWDDILGDSTDPRAAIKVARALAVADARLAAVLDAAVCSDEGFKSAQKDAYVSPVGDGAGPFTITAGYKHHAQTVARQRVALAGARLANMLNKELK